MGYWGVSDSAALWGIGVSATQLHCGVLGCQRVSSIMGYRGVSDSAALWDIGVSVTQQNSMRYKGATSSAAFYGMLGCQ